MARKEIGIPLDRENRNNHNDNFKELYGVVNNFVGTITDEVYEQIIDGSKLNWKEPVDKQSDLPSSASEGDTRMVRDTGKVYRFGGSNWQEIQQIDAGPVNELDSRLTAQLAETATKREVKTNKDSLNKEIDAVDKRVDNLVIPISPENTNIEVTDAHHSRVKDKIFDSLKDRFEDNEKEFEKHRSGELQNNDLGLEVPNGAKNEIIVDENKTIIRVKSHIIPSYEVHDFVERERVNTVSILKPVDSAGEGNLYVGWMALEGFTEYKKEGIIPFEVEYENHFSTANTFDQARVVLPKTVSSIAEARDYIAGRKMVYELSEYEEEPLPENMTPNTKELLRLMVKKEALRGVVDLGVGYDDSKVSSGGRMSKLHGNTNVMIEVKKIVRGSLKPLVSHDGDTWIDVNAINKETNNSFEYIHNPGTFIVDAVGYKYFKLPLRLPFNTGSADVSVYEVPYTPIHAKEVERVSPSPLRPESELVTGNNASRPTSVKKDGTWYGVTGNSFNKSEDYGKTWISIHQVGDDRARQVRALNDGTLLLFTKDGKVLKSNKDETDFEEKLSTISPDVQWSELISIDVFDNFVFVNEYGTKISDDPCRRAFMSSDYGETWSMIFEEEIRGNFHIHHIAYDPYDDLIWIVTGDGHENSNVIISNDFGNSWRYVYEYGECPNQFTSVLPMPNCVLFLSDNRHDSVYRWDRINSSIESTERITLEPAYTIVRENQGSESIGTTGYVDYNGDGSVYFGFAQHHSSINRRAKVYATKNGYDFYPIWTAPYKLSSETGFVGVYHISGIDDEGYMAVALSGTGGNENLKIKKPHW